MQEKQICHYCQLPMDKVTKDHKYPVSKIKKIEQKGLPYPDDVDLDNNIVLSCLACNMNKAAKNYNDFKALGLKKIRHLKKVFLDNQYRIKRVKGKYKKNRKRR